MKNMFNKINISSRSRIVITFLIVTMIVSYVTMGVTVSYATTVIGEPQDEQTVEIVDSIQEQPAEETPEEALGEEENDVAVEVDNQSEETTQNADEDVSSEVSTDEENAEEGVSSEMPVGQDVKEENAENSDDSQLQVPVEPSFSKLEKVANAPARNGSEVTLTHYEGVKVTVYASSLPSGVSIDNVRLSVEVKKDDTYSSTEVDQAMQGIAAGLVKSAYHIRLFDKTTNREINLEGPVTIQLPEPSSLFGENIDYLLFYRDAAQNSTYEIAYNNDNDNMLTLDHQTGLYIICEPLSHPPYTHAAQKADVNVSISEIRAFPIDGGNFSNGEVAYCYNKSRAYPDPYIGAGSSNSEALYWEVENADGAEFLRTATYPLPGLSGEELRSRVISVVANGYPKDALNLKQQYGFTDKQLYIITQMAVWYYTDHNVINNNQIIENYLYQYFQHQEQKLANAVNSVNALINSNLNLSENVTAGINLFETDIVKIVNGQIIDNYYQNLLSVNINEFNYPNEPGGNSLEAVISARKTVDGQAPGDRRFTFVLKNSSGVEVARTQNDAQGNIYFTLHYDTPGTYTYTIEEINDGQQDIEYDTSVKTVTVTVTAHDLQTYDENSTYYGWDSDPSGYENFVIDATPGGSGIQMFCTNRNRTGPSDSVSPRQQTYRAIINPSNITTGNNGMIAANRYGDQLEVKLKKLFYYLQTPDADQFAIDEKQKLVWSATGVQSNWGYDTNTINGQSVVSGKDGIYNVLDKIYETTTLPEVYNLVFFLPTGEQAAKRPQPLATGYGAKISYVNNSQQGNLVSRIVFNNKTIVAPNPHDLTLSKTVTGTAGDKSRLFNFTISLKDKDNHALSGAYQVESSAIAGVNPPTVTSINFNAQGTASVQLKHGQTIKIKDLPDGFFYTVVETEYNKEGYTSSVTGDASSNMSNTGAAGDINVTYVNHKDMIVPTGFNSGLMPSLIIFILSVSLAITYGMSKIYKKLDSNRAA